METKIKAASENKESAKDSWLKIGAWILGAVVVLQSPILTLIPRFFEAQIKVVNGQIPPALWALGVASIVAAVFTAIDKGWAKKREDAAKAAQEKAKTRRAQNDRFFKGYAECLALAIQAAQDSETQGIEKVRETQVAVLQLVRDVVTLFLDKPDGLSINASLMRAEPTERWSENNKLKSVNFCAPTRDVSAYRCVLHLTQWAKKPNDVAHFALPVAQAEDILLFGAPRAFLHDGLEYIVNTQDEASVAELLNRQDDAVRHEVRAYLEARKDHLVSFICLALRCGEEVVGVLNVQSNQPEILGAGEEYTGDLQNSLLPFCALLGILIAQENRSQKATVMPEETSKPQ